MLEIISGVNCKWVYIFFYARNRQKSDMVHFAPLSQYYQGAFYTHTIRVATGEGMITLHAFVSFFK